MGDKVAGECVSCLEGSIGAVGVWERLELAQNTVRIPTKQLESSRRFMTLTSSAFAVRAR